MNEKPSSDVAVSGRSAAKHLRIIWEFAAALREQGYAVQTVKSYLHVVEHCSRWMVARALFLPVLDEAAVEKFLRKHLPHCRCPRPAPRSVRHCGWVLGCLLSFLRERRLARPRPSAAPSEAERLIHRYDRYLCQVCGLADHTRRERRCYADQFLKASFGRSGVDPRRLVPRDIRQFIEHRAADLQTGTLRVLATTLRSFLRFLHVNGLVHEHLTEAVVCPAPAPRNPPPQTLSENQVRTFLRSFDRRQPIGQRDFAMALCLCHLGLRVQEVARLEVQDLDWTSQTLHLRTTKSRRGRVLPLPPEVAKAIALYLRDGRPSAQTRVLFARHRVPGRASQGVHLVQSAMRRGFIRAGLGRLGVHRLRHTFATRLHRRGVDIKIIADLLGHKVLDTTARYARVNFEELRQAALPWPKG